VQNRAATFGTASDVAAKASRAQPARHDTSPILHVFSAWHVLAVLLSDQPVVLLPDASVAVKQEPEAEGTQDASGAVFGDNPVKVKEEPPSF